MKIQRQPHISRITYSTSVLTLLLLCFFGWLGVQLLIPPKAAPVTAPAEEFSGERAMEYLKHIASDRRIPGTPNHAAVREYLLSELQRLGLEAHVQTTFVVEGSRRKVPFDGGRVHNVVGRLRGTDSEGVIVMMAHYDSVPMGPGAGDDGVGVAALLETARALSAGSPLKHDVVFLLTDAEEYQLLGSLAYLQEHPWVAETRLVFNFEGQGASGPVFMFETSQGNSELIREFAKSVPYPLAGSFSFDVYKNLNFANDFGLFMGYGYKGLGFATISDIAYYHSANDSLANIDTATLQHQGSYALSLARHFGNGSLVYSHKGNAVYFNFMNWLIHYPTSWVLPIACVVGLIFLGIVTLGLVRKRLTWQGMALGLVTFALGFGGMYILTIWMQAILNLGRLTYHANLYYLGFALLTFGVTGVVLRLAQRWIRIPDLASGALIWWFLLMFGSSIFLPSASYIFVWPLLFSSLALGVFIFGDWKKPLSPFGWLVQIVSTVPALILLTPMVILLFVALTLNQPAGAVALLTLVLGLLWPLLEDMLRHLRWVPVTALCLGLVFFVIGAMAGYDAKHPMQNSIFYVLDSDTHTAKWVSHDARVDSWTVQYLGENAKRAELKNIFPHSQRQLLQSDAPVPTGLKAPEITVLEDATDNGVRSLKLNIRSTRQAPTLEFHLVGRPPLVGSMVNGKWVTGPVPLDKPMNWVWGFRYYDAPVEGVEVVFMTPAGQQLELVVMDQNYALPELAGFSAKPRSAEMIPVSTNYVTDCTFVTRRVVF